MAENTKISISKSQNHADESFKIQNLIYVIRDKQVMIDSDLAMLYNVETKRLNEAVKRNIERFPIYFRFQLTEEEYQYLGVSQNN